MMKLLLNRNRERRRELIEIMIGIDEKAAASLLVHAKKTIRPAHRLFALRNPATLPANLHHSTSRAWSERVAGTWPVPIASPPLSDVRCHRLSSVIHSKELKHHFAACSMFAALGAPPKAANGGCFWSSEALSSAAGKLQSSEALFLQLSSSCPRIDPHRPPSQKDHALVRIHRRLGVTPPKQARIVCGTDKTAAPSPTSLMLSLRLRHHHHEGETFSWSETRSPPKIKRGGG